MGATPIFVGGTGRSGTTVVGRLLGQHSGYEVIPFELRLHAERRGLPGLIGGTVTPEQFAETVFEQWFVRPGKPRAGLQRISDRWVVESAVAEFLAAAADDGVAAARRFIATIVEPYIQERGKEEWVEMTPRNLIHASDLRELFPTARFVHVVRDGRDVAASLLRKGWGPDIVLALEWWAKRMRQAHHGTSRLPAGSITVVQLEKLVEWEPAASYAALLDFLGWEDEPLLRTYFTETLSGGRANIGGWRSLLPRGTTEQAFEQRYSRLLQGLRKAGVSALPDSG